jgi:hypothetical protein
MDDWLRAERELERGALHEAFRAALLLTATPEAAEYAVLGGIAALEFGVFVTPLIQATSARRSP